MNDETPTLRDLVLQARDKGLSYRQMEEMVEASEARVRRGLKLNRTTASKIARGKHSGDAEDGTIRAIALVAGVTEDVAFTAAGRKLDGEPFAKELPVGIDDLSTRERRVALDLLRVLVAQRQEINRYESAASSPDQTQPRTPGEAEREDQEAKVYTLKSADQAPDVDDPEPDFTLPGAAYTPKIGEKGSREAREQDELADRPDPEGPDEGV